MIIAAYYVENLFVRAKVFNQEDNSLSSKIQKAVAELNTLFDKIAYSTSDKAKMLILIYACGLKISELIKLRKVYINWDQKRIFIKAAKGKKDSYVVLPDKLALTKVEAYATVHTLGILTKSLIRSRS